jgi:ceramide glucosyltransferase
VTLIILAALLLPVWAYAVASIWAAIRFSRRLVAPPAATPPISVLKPLHGAESGLVENLCSFVDQDYPSVQVVLGVRSSADTAVPIAQAVIESRPASDITLVVDPRASGSNLKVANLENMLSTARHDLLVIADSDMRVGRSYLAALAGPLQDPTVGVVTCAYQGTSTGGVWSDLGAMNVNFGFLPAALLGEAIGWGGGCFGATLALRREVLDRIGGLARLRNELADDHRMGSAARELGLTTVLSPYIVDNRISEASFASLWRHELRWARTSRLMAPGGFAGSVVTHTMVIGLLAVLAAELSPIAIAFLGISCLLRWGSAIAVARLFGLSLRRFWLLPVRDLLSFAVFAASFCGRNVLWRGQLFKIDEGGRITAEGDEPV